jgi:hypothetical protein
MLIFGIKRCGRDTIISKLSVSLSLLCGLQRGGLVRPIFGKGDANRSRNAEFVSRLRGPPGLERGFRSRDRDILRVCRSQFGWPGDEGLFPPMRLPPAQGRSQPRECTPAHPVLRGTFIFINRGRGSLPCLKSAASAATNLVTFLRR